MDLHERERSGESTGEQVSRCHGQQLGERHAAAAVELHWCREPEVDRVVKRVAAAAGALVLGAGLLITATPAQAATGAITGLAGKCVDVAAANSADGTPVQLYDCNGTNAQQWTRPGDGTIRALGKCLDVNAGSVADGAKVQLWTCNRTGAQQWVYSSGHDLVNPQANKCLDVTGNNSANGTPLQIWTCTGAANQKWTV